MSVCALDRAAFAPAAHQIELNRSRIVNSALREALPPEQRTLLAEVLVENTIDHLLAWLQQPAASRIFAWIYEALRDHAEDPALFALFPSTVNAALDVLAFQSALSPDIAATFNTLRRDVHIHMGAHRTAVSGRS